MRLEQAGAVRPSPGFHGTQVVNLHARWASLSDEAKYLRSIADRGIVRFCAPLGADMDGATKAIAL